ncbi:MAG: YcnI family protein [Pigmentiphaga sp.]
MSFQTALAAAAVALVALPLSPVSAHVTLAQSQAQVGVRHQAVLRVPHGCQGSSTIGLRVRIPEGFIGVKPQPKPGWALDVVRGEYAQPHRLFGSQVSSGVQEIRWNGGPLLDEHYDEFVFVGYASGDLTPGDVLYFPVVQECEQGVSRWIDRPAPDSPPATDHSDAPAPALTLVPRQP